MNDGICEWEDTGSGRLSIKKILGESLDTVHKKGYAINLHEEFVKFKDGKFYYSNEYKTEDKVPLAALLTAKDVWLWHDPMRRQFLVLAGKFDLTFYDKARDLLKNIDDAVLGVDSLSKLFKEKNVERYYILVEKSVSGKYTVTVGRKKGKKEHSFHFFADSAKEFFENVVKELAAYFKSLLKEQEEVKSQDSERE